MKHIISSGLYLLTLFLLSQYIFVPANIYKELWWFDIPMHIMGGFGVAAFTSALLTYKQKEVSFKVLLTSFFIVAFLWEVYEYVKDFITLSNQNDIIDTISDFVNGALGAVIAYWLVTKK